ncbi:Oligopeptide transport ATP-binding protein OppD [Phycisphaerales bacterium]|nr:Oligopeptide transport ATP-binding protein OppD [Phycisphaerales bacterium]
MILGSPWPDAMSALLTIHDLAVSFANPGGARIQAVDGVSLSLHARRTLAVVGESGSGKSVTALAAMGLLPPSARIDGGSILLHARDAAADSTPPTEIVGLPLSRLRQIRGRDIAMIFQEPMTSLNPVFTIGEQLTETIQLHRRASAKEARTLAAESLREVGIDDPARRLDQYPHEFSGGMRQRVMIAMALIGKPRILLADEPTTALDVTIQAQVLDLLAGLKDSRGLAIMLITHDLGLVQRRADTVAVMYAGRVVELAPAADLFARPMHPYTRCLLKCRPHAGSFGQRLATVRELMDDPREFQPIDGRVAWWPHREQRAEVSMHPVAESHTVAVWQ